MSIVIGFDAIRVNLPHVPPHAQLAGYTTGSGDVPWAAADWAAHPGAIRICQDPAASDGTADVLDVERGAATIADAAPWYRRAAASYQAVTRPGQRLPAFYCSASSVTPLANAFVAAGIKSGPRLIVASWDLSEPQAAADVAAASGPYPIVGVQYASGPFYDTDVWSGEWLAAVSHHAPVPVPVPSWVQQAYQGVAEIEADLGEVLAILRPHIP